MSNPLDLAMSVAREFRRLPGLRRLYENTDPVRRAHRLAKSGLIDLDLYGLQLGVDQITLDEAATHYVRWGHRGGLTINALIDDTTLRAGMPRSDRPPVYDYLWNRDWTTPVSPFWDVGAYTEEHPESLAHPQGPVGHLWERARAEPDVEITLSAPGGGRALRLGDHVAAIAESLSEWARTDLLRRERALSPVFHGVDSLGDWPAERPQPLISIVLATWNRSGTLRDSVDSALGQTWHNWELLIVDDGSWDDTPAIGELLTARDDRVRFIRRPHEGVSAARNAGIGLARGDFITFLDSDNTWAPRFLENMMVAMRDEAASVAFATLEVDGGRRPLFREAAASVPALELGNVIDLNTLVVSSEAMLAVGGFDTELARAVDYDLILRLAAVTPIHHVPVLGALYDNGTDSTDRISTSQPLGWNNRVRIKNLVDWDAVERGDLAAGTSVTVMVARQDPRIDEKLREITALAADPTVTVHLAMLDAAPPDWARARAVEREHAGVVAHLFPGPEAYSFVVTMMLTVADRAGFAVIEPSSRFDAGTLRTLADRVDPGRRRMVAPLSVHPDGTIVTIGAAFPKKGAAPVDMLSRHPIEDAQSLGADVSVPALSGRSFALPTKDLQAIRGLDPLLYNEYELPAAALRLRELFPDYEFATLADVHLRRVSVTNDFARIDQSGSLTAIRTATTSASATDLDAIYRPLDLTVRHFRAVETHAAGPQPRTSHDGDTDLAEPVKRLPPLRHLHPVVVRSRRMVEVEGRLVPRLRWAIRIAAPAFPEGGTWGDTHFARSLARALESLGQEVVIDHHEVRLRPTAYLDDVTLVLRGLDHVEPATGGLSILWIISHPDLVTRSEAALYDHVFAASTQWSRRAEERWGLRVAPLLQCTDPEIFHPTGESRTSDIVFVGKSRGVARPAVVYPIRAGIPVRVFGGDWDGIVPVGTVEAEYFPNDRLGALYGTAGAVLNDHWSDMRRDGFISNRLFDVVASGGRVFSDRVEGIDEIFGPAVVQYDSPIELVELLQGGLTELFPAESELALTSARIREQHSFLARARELLNLATADLPATDPRS